MPLAPIRGAPPGAPIPDFPGDAPAAQPEQPSVAPVVAVERTGGLPPRRRQTPIRIHGDGSVLTFRVVPEIPAINRSSMIIEVGTASTRPSVLHTLEMSIVEAVEFLTGLRDGRSPAATRDRAGMVRVEYEISEAGGAFVVRGPGDRSVVRRFAVDRSFDAQAMASDLLADLGS